MTKREAKRRACHIAATILHRGGQWPEALMETAEEEDGQTLANMNRMEAAWKELCEELYRRAGADVDVVIPY